MNPTRRADGSATNPVSVIGNGPLARAIRKQYSPDLKKVTDEHVLVIDHGNDARTIAALRPALNDLSTTALPPKIVAEITDRRLRRAVQSRIEEAGITPRPFIVSAADIVAEHFARSETLFETAYWRNQSRLHIAIVGFDHTGKSFLDALATSGIAGALQRPLIHIVTADQVGTHAFLHKEMPEIDKSAEIVVSPCLLDDLGNPERSPLVAAEESAPLTAILLLLEEATETLLASASIADLQDRHGFASAALFIGGAGSEEAGALTTPIRPRHNLGRRLKSIDGLATIDSLIDYILKRRDALAKQLHESYLHGFGGQTAGGTAWNLLPETYRRANRRAAWHLYQKLWTMGLSMPHDQRTLGAIEPFTYENMIKPVVASITEDETIRRLARLEHERWCAERRLDGWRYGEVRDDKRRRHPSLVSFDDPRLTNNDIDKDIAQIRFLLESMLRPAPAGAAIRFVVGVVATSNEVQPGLPLSTICEQIAAEAHRIVILLSPLLDERELAAALILTDMLDRELRPFQFIIPEWYPANKPLRKLAAGSNAKLQSLLKRPQICVAPMGPAGFFNENLWDDPSDSDAARKALSYYVTQRSHALVQFE